MVVKSRLEEKDIIVARVPIEKVFCIFIDDYCCSCLKRQVPKS